MSVVLNFSPSRPLPPLHRSTHTPPIVTPPSDIELQTRAPASQDGVEQARSSDNEKSAGLDSGGDGGGDISTGGEGGHRGRTEARRDRRKGAGIEVSALAWGASLPSGPPPALVDASPLSAPLVPAALPPSVVSSFGEESDSPKVFDGVAAADVSRSPPSPPPSSALAAGGVAPDDEVVATDGIVGDPVVVVGEGSEPGAEVAVFVDGVQTEGGMEESADVVSIKATRVTSASLDKVRRRSFRST